MPGSGSGSITQRCLSVFSRRKATVSRERLKLLFKQHCEPVNGTIAVKVMTDTCRPQMLHLHSANGL